MTEIHKGDVIEFQGKQENYTFGGEFAKGASVRLLAPKGQTFSSGTILYRTKNEQLLTELEEAYSLGKIKEKIYGSVLLSVGKPAKLTLRYGDLLLRWLRKKRWSRQQAARLRKNASESR